MTLIQMAEAIDTMDQDVTSWEADFLESVLVRLKEGRNLSFKQEQKLKQIYEKYFDDEPSITPPGPDPNFNVEDF